MPVLHAPELELTLDLSTPERMHWLIGRGRSCDVILADTGVSRYHATVFRMRERFYLLDHSLNGTFLCRPAEAPSDATRLPTTSALLRGGSQSKPPHATDTAEVAIPPELISEMPSAAQEIPSLHKSHAELRAVQLDHRLPRLAGYVAHGLRVPADMQPILEMVYSAEEVETLASMGRILTPEMRIVIGGKQRHEIRYDE